MTYTALQRLQDTLNGRPRDHVPVFPLVAGWVATHFGEGSPAEVARDPHRLVAAQLRAREAMQWDPVYAYVDPLYIPEAFGCRVRFGRGGALVDPLPISVTSREDLDRLPAPDARRAGRLPVILAAAAGLGRAVGAEAPVVGLFEGPFTTLCRVLPTEWVMRMVYKRRAVVEALLDRITVFLIRVGGALLENGANTLLIPEPTASAAMISPAAFEEIVQPRLRELLGALQAVRILHICGDTAVVLKSMAGSGADVLSLDQCMDMAACRHRVPAAVLGGNVDPVRTLMQGSTERVAAETRACLKAAGTRRFVLMSGCGVPPAAPRANLEALVVAAREYGPGDPEGAETITGS